MATQATTSDQRATFESLLRQWENRVRLRQALIWLPRAAVMGMGAAVGLAFVSRSNWGLPDSDLITMALVILAVTIGTLLLMIYLRPRRPLRAAQDMDIEFGLQERVSTAIELMDGRITADAEISGRQVEDAWMTARQIDPRQGIALEVRLREWVIFLVLVAIFAVLLLLPDPANANDGRSAGATEAIESAEDTARDITESVAAETGLEQEERDQLLETLETSLDTLNDEDTSTDEAFAAMRDIEDQLREQANNINQELMTQQQALDAAADALNREPSESGEAEDIPTLDEMLSETRESLETLDPAEFDEVADALEEAAQNLEGIDPDLAEQLRDAAQDIREGDTQSAQQNIDQALENLENLTDSMEQREQTGENLEEAADEAQEASEEISESEQAQEGNEETDNAQQGDQGEQQQIGASENIAPQEGAEPITDIDADLPPSSESSADQTGAGDASGDEAPIAEGFEEQDGPIDQDNNPTGEGERDYEAIYDPQRVGENETGENDIVLEPDAGDTPSIEGEFGENPEGESMVTYDQVFSDYQNAANSAIDAGFVPPSRRDIVREYFTSLQPESDE